MLQSLFITYNVQCTNNTMKPYHNDDQIGVPKYKAERHDGIPGTAKGITKGAKEQARNANRSRKKSHRQQIKLELRQYY